jgi:superfamily II DNA/RNA helicase
MSFSSLGLSEKVLAAVEAAGYTEPTAIQAAAIPHVLQKRDVLGLAQTGTGKTASFTLPMLTLLEKGRARARMPRTLILEPTRELAAQVEENFNKYGINHKLNVALLIGGTSFGDQDKKLDRGVDVLIATPGRLLDHTERGKLLLQGVDILVIDEADRMLDMGFIPDIERICKLIPMTRQTLFFSATMPPEIQRLVDTFLHNPARVEVARTSSTADTVTQNIVASGSKDFDKRDTLRRMIDKAENLTNAIIFCNRKSDVDIVAKSLKKYGLDAAPIHGDLDQSQRTRTLDLFRSGELRFLVASDVAARGLDVPAVSHVFNFDVPSHAEDYVHRIGRTGRAGRTGKAMMICVPRDEKNLADIERLIQKEIPRLEEFSQADKPRQAETDADTAPRAETESKPRSRSRSRSRSTPVEASQKNASDKPAPEKPAAEKSAPEKTVPDNRASEKPEQPAESKGRSRGDRGGRQPSNRQGNNNQGGGNKTVGMGDHMPGFIAKSFDDRRTN